MILNNDTLEVTSEMKLLGVKISDDMKWNSNTSYITQKSYSRLWLLRRLKVFGANQQELLDVYCKQVRSVIEFGAVVWHPWLTQINSADIERVQKSAWAIILGQEYTSYESALHIVGLDKLTTRREKLCLNFVRQSVKTHPHCTIVIGVHRP